MNTKLREMALEVAVEYQIEKANIQHTAKLVALLQVGLVIGASLMSSGANAATLRESAISIFTLLYGIVGVVGAIAVMITGINWASGNPFGNQDPKRNFFYALGGTAIGLSAVTIVLAIKEFVGGTADVSQL